MTAYHKKGKVDHQEQQQNNAYLQLTMSEIMGKAKEGLLALSIELGLQTIRLMIEQEVDSLVGPKGVHNPNRTAYRHGHEQSHLVVGGRKVSVKKPRVRSIEGQEVPLNTLSQFQASDPLTEAVLARMLHGVASRAYQSTLESFGPAVNSEGVSKSSVSRRFIAGTEKKLQELMQRPLGSLRMVALMIDGVAIGEHMLLAALGIDDQGKKHILGIQEGATENSSVCKSLLADLTERGLSAEQGLLVVIDGSKALAKAVKDVFGDRAVIQRCQVHKRRNVLEHLPESEKERIGRKIKLAYMEFEYAQAKFRLERIIEELDERYPGAANSLREGLEEILTVHKLNLPGRLRRSLSSTNLIESANSVATNVFSRVKNWRSGNQVLRWAAAGFLMAEEKFRRIQGYRDLTILTTQLQMAINKSDSIKSQTA